jgi:methylated-DNA-[protein]-cysteine S-methyltransferase
MEKKVKYTIFKTKLGYFGLAAQGKTLLGAILPLPNPRKVESLILKKYPNAEYQKYLLKSLQEKITAYFEGIRTDFNTTPILLDGLRPFTISVLTACRNIPYSQTMSYSKIAQKIYCPKAARAVGNALAKNPLPLIIPCHRVIRSDGSCGNFSAAGGKKLKQKLLKLEKTNLPA